MKYQVQVLQLLRDGQGHQGIEKNYCLMLGVILLEYHVPRCYQICKGLSMVPTVKGDYTDPNTIQGVIIVNNPMDLVCSDFTKVELQKMVKKTSWF